MLMSSYRCDISDSRDDDRDGVDVCPVARVCHDDEVRGDCGNKHLRRAEIEQVVVLVVSISEVWYEERHDGNVRGLDHNPPKLAPVRLVLEALLTYRSMHGEEMYACMPAYHFIELREMQQHLRVKILV